MFISLHNNRKLIAFIMLMAIVLALLSPVSAFAQDSEEDKTSEKFSITDNQRFVAKISFILALGLIFFILQGKYFKR